MLDSPWKRIKDGGSQDGWFKLGGFSNEGLNYGKFTVVGLNMKNLGEESGKIKLDGFKLQV